MANQIIGNTYILDTQSGNTVVPWLRDAKVQSIVLWASNSTGEVQLAGATTTNVIIRITNPLNVPNTVGIFLGGVYLTDTLTLPILTAGTAWIHFV